MARIIAIVSALLLLSCAPTAEEIARTVLDIPADQDVDTATVRRAALAVFPVGTPESSVVSYLHGFGLTEGDSSRAFYLSTDSGLVLRFEDASGSRPVESYGVRLGLDDQRRVRSVQVERWLTGL